MTLDIFHLDAVALLYECHAATQRYMLPLHHIAPKRGKNKKKQSMVLVGVRDCNIPGSSPEGAVVACKFPLYKP